MTSARTLTPRRIATLTDAQAALNDVAAAYNDLASRFFWGEGTPEGAIKAPVGCVFLRTDGGIGTTLYAKEAGTDSTGWAPK